MTSPAMPKLILASSSPYRRLLLERLGLPFTTVPPVVDETPQPNERPADTAVRLAEAKARGVAATHAGGLYIRSDQGVLRSRRFIRISPNHAAARNHPTV